MLFNFPSLKSVKYEWWLLQFPDVRLIDVAPMQFRSGIVNNLGSAHQYNLFRVDTFPSFCAQDVNNQVRSKFAAIGWLNDMKLFS